MNNNVELGKKHYVDTKQYHDISTETRNWIIQEKDIGNDGSVLKAIQISPVKAKAVHFQRLIKGERID